MLHDCLIAYYENLFQQHVVDLGTREDSKYHVSITRTVIPLLQTMAQSGIPNGTCFSWPGAPCQSFAPISCLSTVRPSNYGYSCLYACETWRVFAGSVGPTQLAQLFTNLGNPLPYDRLSSIMQQYDVSKSGTVAAP